MHAGQLVRDSLEVKESRVMEYLNVISSLSQFQWTIKNKKQLTILLTVLISDTLSFLRVVVG